MAPDLLSLIAGFVMMSIGIGLFRASKKKSTVPVDWLREQYGVSPARPNVARLQILIFAVLFTAMGGGFFLAGTLRILL